MGKAMKARLRCEVLFSVFALALAVVTAVSHSWIETVSSFDPDHGSGAAEWLIVAALCLLAVILGVLARRDLRRMRAGGASA